MQELIDITKELYDRKLSYRQIAKKLDLSVSKVIKLLITCGVYSSDICRKINRLYASGKTIPEIQKSLNISRASVQAYLPYRKCVYNAKELSLNAERIRRYRQRKKAKQMAISPGFGLDTGQVLSPEEKEFASPQEYQETYTGFLQLF